MSDHERIWLMNAEDAKEQGEGRMWCEDKVWPDDPGDGEPTEYVRADIADSLAAELAKVSDAIGTVEFMDPPDGGDVSLSEQVRRMAAELAKAREALLLAAD